MPADERSPGAKGQADVERARTSTAPTDADNDRRVVGDPAALPTAINDPTGRLSNRLGGTIQREPTPEQMPPDAKIAPVLEQVAPNQAGLAVGARPTPETIAGVEQPEEGEKNVVPDATDAKQFLSPESNQQDAADRAVTQQGVVADDAAVGASPALNTDGTVTSKEDASGAQPLSSDVPDKPGTTTPAASSAPPKPAA